MSINTSSPPKRRRPNATRTRVEGRLDDSRGHNRAKTLQIRLNDDECAALNSLAESRGIPVSTLARDLLLGQLTASDTSTKRSSPASAPNSTHLPPLSPDRRHSSHARHRSGDEPRESVGVAPHALRPAGGVRPLPQRLPQVLGGECVLRA